RGAQSWLRGGETRSGVWHVPHDSRPKSFMMASVAAAFLLRAASRSFSEFIWKFLASASNSDHFCQISGLALDSGVIEPSGNSFGISRAFIAIVSAFTAMPSMLPALNLAWASDQLAPFSFISLWRSATISAALILGALLSVPAHPPYTSAPRVP